ncbi:YadA C-terminal domain-containing protein [Acinetobacter sp. YH01020]|uniref:YadA C-terminal domain-containing protein n=1 Tax=Acinetobacter sp. YH01020 TaxID=2601034 RepID=UPI00211F34C8|nr:YadA C-terminal domain-containing protein [Acinetobacter sp. YH01020]
MKFQKSLLAASLAVAAVSTVNAAVVVQEAKPVQVTENLVDNKFVNSDNFFEDSTGARIANSNLVYAPVHSELASTYNTNTQGTNKITSDYLPLLSDITNRANELVGIDLGSKAVTGEAGRTDFKYDVFKYTSKDGTTVYRLQQVESQQYVPGTFTLNASNVLVANNQISAEAIQDKSIWSLERGGQLQGSDFTTNTGYENKVINGEHVLYGYQGQTGKIAGQAQGNVVTPTANNQPVEAVFDGVNGVVSNDLRYVQSGIIANTGDYKNGINGADPYLDPAKNIYGVSARDNNNVVMMTGNGIALADLNSGILQTDGSVLVNSRSGETSVSQKTRSYNFDGKKLVEVYNDVPGTDFTTQWYEVGANNQLVAYAGATPAVGTHDKTGTANFTTGLVNNASVHNTVTNKNVTYKESVVTTKEDRIDASVTSSTGADTEKFGKQNSSELVSETKQQVSTGVIGTNDDKSNKYGTEVSKTVTADGKTTVEKTTITAGGITTTGVINAADYQIGGVSIVDGIKTSVDTAVAGATEAIDAKVAEVDTKIVEVDARLTQFNTTAANLNSRVDQLNSRVDDVEKTAYRGVAIALAAQQQIPNIGAGQFAVFGGVGHYEGESAGALGVASVFADGRTSLSAALGFAGGSEVGGRVGLSYVFGGK